MKRFILLLVLLLALPTFADYATTVDVVEEVISRPVDEPSELVDLPDLSEEDFVADTLETQIDDVIAESESSSQESESIEQPVEELFDETILADSLSDPDMTLPPVEIPLEDVESAEEVEEVTEEVVVPARVPSVEESLFTLVDDLENSVDNSLIDIFDELDTFEIPEEELDFSDIDTSGLETELGELFPSAELIVEDAEGNEVKANIEVVEDVKRVSIEFEEGPLEEMHMMNSELEAVPRVDDVPESLPVPVEGATWAEVYAIDPTNTDFELGVVEVIAKGTSLYKCKDWNFDARSCDGSWRLLADDLTPGARYLMEIDPLDPGFGEIIATNAIHLDENRTMVSNVFNEITAIDDIWTQPVYEGQYVRTTFETELTNGNVIDFLAFDHGTVSFVEVYVANTDVLVGKSGIADSAELQYITLENVPEPTDTFDLKVVKHYFNTSYECDVDEETGEVEDCKADDLANNAKQGYLLFDFIHDEALTSSGAGGLLVYGESGVDSPRYRSWNQTSQNFSSELSALDLGNDPRQIVLRANHERDEFILAYFDQSGASDAQIFNGTSWGNSQTLGSETPNLERRSIDVAVEGISGDSLVVYEDSTSNNSNIKYQTWDGTSWSGESSLTLGITSQVHWVTTVPKKSSDDIMVLLHHSSDYLVGILWNGSSFVSSTEFNISTDMEDEENELFDFVWESNSGDGLVAYGVNSGSVRYRTFDSSTSSWSSDQQFYNPGLPYARYLRLCSDPTSDYVGAAILDTANDGVFRIWDGDSVETSPAPPTKDDNVEGTGVPNILMDCAFTSEGDGIFAYVDGDSADDENFRTCMYDKSSWSSADMSSCTLSEEISDGSSIDHFELYSNPITNEIMAAVLEGTSVRDLRLARWNGSLWINTAEPELNLECNSYQSQCFQFAWSSYDPSPNISVVIPVNSTDFTQLGQVNITANISDNLAVNIVNFTITKPNGTSETFDASLISGSSTQGLYQLIYNSTSTIGQYNFTVNSADNSTHDNFISSSGFFDILGPSLTVTKTDSSDPVLQGNQLNYSILISNTGSVIAANVTALELYPSGVLFNSSQPTPIGNNTFEVGNLSAGENFTINITVDVSDSVTSTQNNTVVINFSDIVGSIYQVNDSELTEVLSGNISIVSLTKIESSDPVIRGQQLNYTIFVNSTGNGTAINVNVTETYPAISGVSFHSASPAPSSGNNTFSLGNLSAGENTTINITLNISSSVQNSTTLNNTVVVDFVDEQNAAFFNSTSILTTVVGFPEITTTKNDSSDPLFAGNSTTYTIFVNNTGDDVAFNVSLVEIYSSESIEFHNSSPAPSSGNNTFNIGNLTPGQSTTINITLNTSSEIVNNTVLTNSYNITFENSSSEPYTINNSESTTVLSNVSAPAPVSTPSSSSSGGNSGGGGGASSSASSSSASSTASTHLAPAYSSNNSAEKMIEVVRGEQIGFPLEVFNFHNRSVLTDVVITIENTFANYSSWTPASLEDILFEHSKEFFVTLNSPSFEGLSELEVSFNITGVLEEPMLTISRGVPSAVIARRQISEQKTVRLVIVEPSEELSEELLSKVNELYQEVISRSYPHSLADQLMNELSEARENNPDQVPYVAAKLESLLTLELEAGDAIASLKERISSSRELGVDYSNLKHSIELAASAFEAEDFDKALSRANAALTIPSGEMESVDILSSISQAWIFVVLLGLVVGIAIFVIYKKFVGKHVKKVKSFVKKKLVKKKKETNA